MTLSAVPAPPSSLPSVKTAAVLPSRLDPAYCDVIVQRWEAYTGKKAERVEAS